MSLDKLLILNHKTDTVPTPPAGKVYIWPTNSNSIKYKDSTGTEYTLATGVSPEDVQDIIGAFIQAQNNKVSITYNDGLNVLSIGINEANIVHQNLSGAGTNTHSQIDSHINNTSNPHGTTAAQVGADPSGSAANAQAFSIQRSSHTGTQLAATISNFASTVLATVLSSFAVGANTAILATDTILQAFGKVQGQINFILGVLSTLVLGDQFEQFLDNTPFSTTSGANQVAASFTTASKQPGLYRLGLNWRWTTSTGTSDAIFGVYVDGVLQDAEHNKELQDATTNQWFYQLSYLTLTSGTHTIELRARNETAGNTLTVSHVIAEIWRVN